MDGESTGPQGHSATGPQQEVRRVLSADQVAARLGREKRVVLLWVEKGCPHVMGMRRRKPSPNFNLEEVKGWLARSGLDVDRRDGDKAQIANQQIANSEGGLPGGVDREKWALLGEAGRGQDGFEREIARLRAAIDLLFAGNPPGTAAEKQRWAQSMTKCMGELRQLAEARTLELKLRGELLDRGHQRTLLRAIGDQQRADLRALASDLPREVAAGLAAAGTPAETVEQARRVCAARAAELIGKVLAARAGAIQRAVGEGGEKPRMSTSPMASSSQIQEAA